MLDTCPMTSSRHGRRLHRGLAAGLLAAAAFATPAHAETTIDTASGWDGSQYLWPFGAASQGYTPTYGETLTVPASDQRLQSFTFHLDVPTDVPLRGAVYAWDETTQSVTGAALWSGAAQSTAGYDPGAHAFEGVTFDTGGIDLRAGEHVVAFVTTLEDPSSDPGFGFAAARWGGSDAYAGGHFVFSNDGTFAGLLGDQWGTLDFAPYVDLAFGATFTSSYTVTGFPGARAGARAGQAVPVTFHLTDGGGAPVTTADGLSLSSAPCDGGAASPVTAAGGSGFQADGAGGFQLNWKTVKAWAGTCRMLTLTMPDSSSASAEMSFR